MERRIARRYVTDAEIEIWIPRAGILGRARSAEFPAADMSMFGTSVYAGTNDGLKRGQVVEITIGSESTTAIIRSEEATDTKKRSRYGIEFIKPSEEFLDEVRIITNEARRLMGETVGQENLWLRSG